SSNARRETSCAEQDSVEDVQRPWPLQSCTECISGKKQLGVSTDGFTGNHVRWLGGIQRPLYALDHYANSG
ncbi:hypothetical protein TNIN_333201, partial [Trichonephila inaurata madagascariensis]